MADTVTAAMLVIGDEILSGRTKDRNIGHLADIMTAIGIDLKEVRVVSDDEDDIVAAVNALRRRYTYLFTTGGIGPTHDDITADSVAKAFGVPCEYDAKALCAARCQLCHARHGVHRRAQAHGAHAARRRAHRQSGLRRAGFPHRQRPCHGRRAGDLPGDARQCRANAARPGRSFCRPRCIARLAKASSADRSADIQKAHPDTIIGSYPKYRDGTFWTELVVRSRSQEALDAARAAVEAMVAGLAKKAEPSANRPTSRPSAATVDPRN